MSAVIKRGKVTRADLSQWDGRNATTSRLDASGGTVTGLAVGNEVDVLQVFGAGTSRTRSTISSALDFINTTAATLVFAPGTWTIDESLTIPSNFSCHVPRGCVFSVSSGKTLTFSGPVYAESSSFYTGSGATVLSVDSLVGGKVWIARTIAESAASVTPTDYSYPPGYEGRFGLTADSSTDNTTALQNLISGSAGYVPIRIRRQGSGYYRLTSRVTAPANTQIILEGGAELRWTATVANGTTVIGVTSRPGIDVQGDNFRLEGKGTLTGPQSGSYVAGECGIVIKGTSSASRKSGLYISPGIEIKNWGAYGVLAQWVDGINVTGAHIHDIGHAGLTFLSCDNGSLDKNEIHDMTPGAGGFPYGLSLSHDSEDHVGGRDDDNPFSRGWSVTANEVYNVPLWTGIDTHGGYEINIINNRVYNCLLPINNTKSSGDAAAFAGENDVILGNTLIKAQRDGTATTVVTDSAAIDLFGGTTDAHRQVICAFNVIDGYGVQGSGATGAIRAGHVRNGVILGNVFRNCKGNGIYIAGGNGVCSQNVFDALTVAASSDICIYVGTNNSVEPRWSFHGNKHRFASGTVWPIGMFFSTVTEPQDIGFNDFDSCTTPYHASVTTALVRGVGFYRQGSATYDPGSLADGAGATTTVTVTGAALGDYVDGVSFSLDLQGITLTAWVSAADTVSVRFQNETTGPIDLASGTLRARVKPRN